METTSVNTALTFGEPVWLWALVLVPALAAVFWWAQSRRSALIARIVAPRLREQLASGVNPTMRVVKTVLILLAIALTIVALAKPRMGFVQREIKAKGRDVLLAIDTSRSMLATDVTPTRLARAKLVSQDLMRLLTGDRIGLIAFAGSAFLQAPLTLDYNAVRTTLDELDTNVIPRGGSNLAAAIQTAIDAFGKAEGVVRALVILTDGEELDADGLAAAKRAGEEGVRIFTIGLGSAEGALIPVRTPDGRQDFVRNSAGEPVKSKLDAARLEEIAEVTGGFYTELTPDVAREIFQRGIEPIDEQETGVMSSRQPIEQYEWPVGAALLCLMAWILMGEGRRRKVPGSRGARAAGRTVVARVLVGGLLMGFVSSGRTETGLESYEAGNYDAALSNFENQAESLPEAEKLEFNAGTAAYRSGDYANAVDLFTSALLTEDEELRESSSYNLGNALTRRGEAAKSVETKKADWKDAIQHYTSALELDPENFEAEDNRAIVEKMLEDLEKEEEQKKQEQDEKKDDEKQDQKEDQKDQEKDDQKKDDQKQDQQEQDQQKQDQQDQEGEGDDQPQDQQGEQDEKEGDKGDQQEDGKSQEDQQKEGQEDEGKEGQDGEDKPEDGDGGDESQDQQSSEDGEQKQDGKDAGSQPTPAPTPGERKEGDLESQGDEEAEGEEQGMGEQAAQAGEERDGEMSEAQARNLLRSMQGDEERVRMMEQRDYRGVMRDW